uniref:Protein kinase domain-containing protein n=1 Tax=Aegilops tauschii subsp. strangulata TaxID=200361 RepID=A0A453M705_AEGTS
MAPKITDFGLSRCFDENQSRDITKTILGTMGYLAPEHREGGVIAHSADLYSLGVIIIEILTGQKGYQATDDTQIYSRILSFARRILHFISTCFDQT